SAPASPRDALRPPPRPPRARRRASRRLARLGLPRSVLRSAGRARHRASVPADGVARGAAALLVPPLPDDPGRRVAADDPRPGRGRDGLRAGPDRRALGLPRGQRAALAAPLLRPPLGGRPRPRPRAR